MRILILALSGIGDALLFTPALKLMRQAEPRAQIDVLAMFKGVQDMFERNPHVDRVYFFDFLAAGLLPSLKFIGRLRGKYDATVNVYPSNRREYNAVNFLLGAKKRAGVRYLRRDIQNFGFLNNVRISENDEHHNVVQNIQLCEKLLGVRFGEEPDLEFPLPDRDLENARKYLHAMGVGDADVVIGFHPGGSTLKNHINKRWAPEKFAELGKALINAHKAKVLVFGGSEEQDLKEQIVKMIGPLRAFSIDARDLAHTAAIIERCNVFVSNDSSLLHVASAMKRNVVLVAGPINPAYTHQWKTRHRVVSLGLECSPCFIHSPKPLKCIRTDVKFKCLKELDVELVHCAVLDLMKS